MELSRLKRKGFTRPSVIDRTGESLVLPPLAILGVGCDASRRNPGSMALGWRAAFRLHFHGRRAARRPIYRDVYATDRDKAIKALGEWFSGGYITKIELYELRRLKTTG